MISIASYTKISRTLRHHQAQVQDHVQQQPSQETALNMERYRKAVSSALWVQLALAVCYVPKFIILVVINHRKTYSSRLVVIEIITSILVYFNSTLNPFLYCWRIREVRQAVKQTIRQALCYVLDFIRCRWINFHFAYSNTRWYSIIVIPLCSVISIASYTSIFCTLRHHQAQVHDHVQQQPSQTNVLNMARYRTAVNSALWVQLALVVCYVPQLIMLLVITNRKNHSSHVIVIDAITTILTYFNSTLNPFLYCWKFREVRQAVKQTIRQTLCFPWT